MSADYALSSANVQAFMQRSDQQFDVIVNEEFFHDSFLMFGHKFKAPLVTISMALNLNQLFFLKSSKKMPKQQFINSIEMHAR